jgi:hypothetical protein
MLDIMRSIFYVFLVLALAIQVTARPIIMARQEADTATMEMQMQLAMAEEADNNKMEKQTTAIDMFDQMMQAVWNVASQMNQAQN